MAGVTTGYGAASRGAFRTLLLTVMTYSRRSDCGGAARAGRGPALPRPATRHSPRE